MAETSVLQKQNCFMQSTIKISTKIDPCYQRQYVAHDSSFYKYKLALKFTAALHCDARFMPYLSMLFAANISSLASRRDDISQNFLSDLTHTFCWLCDLLSPIFLVQSFLFRNSLKSLVSPTTPCTPSHLIVGYKRPKSGLATTFSRRWQGHPGANRRSHSYSLTKLWADQ